MRLLRRLPWQGSRRSFNSQHRTPVLPQLHVSDVVSSAVRVKVAYLLHRHPVVRHTPHPLEVEMGYLLEREHHRYCRHETAESATHFMAARGQAVDSLNRADANAIKANYFGLEPYQDAMRVVVQRYQPERRVTPADLWAPEAMTDQPPPRHTLYRKLDDYLYLLVQDEATSKWSLPQTSLCDRETLRMAADRAIAIHHHHGLDCHVWSNAPQATVRLADDNVQLFVYSAAYLSGRPQFASVEPKPKDHAWVTRREMLQYKNDFVSAELLSTLNDIAADSMFES